MRPAHRARCIPTTRKVSDVNHVTDYLSIPPLLDGHELPNGVELSAWYGEDGELVVQVDTQVDTGRVRVNLNEGVLFDGDPELDPATGSVS